MATVAFTPHLARHLSVGMLEAEGKNLREVFEVLWSTTPGLRGYLLDDQGALRKHVVVFIDGQPIRDRVALTDPVAPRAEVYVMQALSGG